MNMQDNDKDKISHDQESDINSLEHSDKDFNESDNGIVSVNDRGDQEDGKGKKIAFLVVVGVFLLVGIIAGLNWWKNSGKEDEANALAEQKVDPSLDSSGKRRDFSSTDPNPPTADPYANANFQSMGDCQDQSIPQQLTDNNGNALLRNGMLVFVCQNGQQILKQPEQAQPQQAQQAQQPVVIQQPQQAQYVPLNNNGSRFGGGIFINPSQTGGMPQSPITRDPAYAQLMSGNPQGQGGSFNGSGMMSLTEDDEEDLPPQQKNTANTPTMATLNSGKVQARFIGDRNFLLAKGRVIRCNLSVKVVSEIGGMASCVIPQPIYSDNGKVVLAEAGSEVIGEYKSISSQGQRRLGILWSRLKTPHGVIVDIDSPAADQLGTGGVSGRVDNRWGSRLGAAFMLSLVQDAIAYGISKETGGNSSTPYMLQNTSDTGKSMAETVLNETINIKPTIFKNQGDPASIYVAKDIDFRGVYELKAN